MATRNITLSLPEDLLKDVKILAVKRDTSVSRLLADLVRELVERESGYEAARRHHMAMLEEGFDLGLNGKIPWTRDEIHER